MATKTFVLNSPEEYLDFMKAHIKGIQKAVIAAKIKIKHETKIGEQLKLL